MSMLSPERGFPGNADDGEIATGRHTFFHFKGKKIAARRVWGRAPATVGRISFSASFWARLYMTLKAEFQEAGLIDNVPAELGLRSSLLPCTTEDPPCMMTVGFIGPTWMDDSVFCFADPHADALERKAAHLCGLLLQKCKEFAMTPNLSPGKTAAMLVFQGPGLCCGQKTYFWTQCPKVADHSHRVWCTTSSCGFNLHPPGMPSAPQGWYETRSQTKIQHRADCLSATQTIALPEQAFVPAQTSWIV